MRKDNRLFYSDVTEILIEEQIFQLNSNLNEFVWEPSVDWINITSIFAYDYQENEKLLASIINPQSICEGRIMEHDAQLLQEFNGILLSKLQKQRNLLLLEVRSDSDLLQFLSVAMSDNILNDISFDDLLNFNIEKLMESILRLCLDSNRQFVGLPKSKNVIFLLRNCKAKVEYQTKIDSFQFKVYEQWKFLCQRFKVQHEPHISQAFKLHFYTLDDTQQLKNRFFDISNPYLKEGFFGFPLCALPIFVEQLFDQIFNKRNIFIDYRRTINKIFQMQIETVANVLSENHQIQSKIKNLKDVVDSQANLIQDLKNSIDNFNKNSSLYQINYHDIQLNFDQIGDLSQIQEKINQIQFCDINIQWLQIIINSKNLVNKFLYGWYQKGFIYQQPIQNIWQFHKETIKKIADQQMNQIYQVINIFNIL